MTTTTGTGAASTDRLSILDDPHRLTRIDELQLLDTPREPSLDRLTRLAAELLDAPTALLSVVDDDRQFFKSSVGLSPPLSDHGETSLADSFCKHVVIDGQPFAVSNALTDPRIGRIVLLGDVAVAAYLGVPLTTRDGIRLGALCVIDTEPRQWGPYDLGVLGNVAELVMADIELRHSAERLNATREEGRRLEATVRRSGQVQRSIIDAIDADVCILDQEGTIIEANKSWIGFVETCPSDPLAAQIGTNLAAEAMRFGEPAVDLDQVLSGLGQVLRDERCSAGGSYEAAGSSDAIPVRVETLRGALRPMAIVFRNQRSIATGAPLSDYQQMTSPFDV